MSGGAEASSVTAPDVIQYVPWSSFVEGGFWHALTQVKLEVERLSEAPREISGSYTHRIDIPELVEIDGTAFNKVPRAPPASETISGSLIHKNTIEGFKDVDKTALLNKAGEKYWAECITNKAWIMSPKKLVKFILIAFSDLKNYHYYYWFAFPAPSQPTVYFAQKSQHLIQHFNENQMLTLADGHKALDKTQKAFFGLVVASDKVEVRPISGILNEEGMQKDVDMNDVYFGFLDPSNGVNPGWPLRNFIAALLEHSLVLAGSEVRFVGLRCKMNGDIAPSMYYKISIPEKAKTVENTGWVGWERNDRGKFGPKLANMSASMDPIKLAETSADLNLKLMKWRLVPNLDLDVLKETKCLLLGAGTLGCHVARDLIAWGFRNITFMDNGRVSYSNPVRQVLYTHADCQNGLKKAIAAAASLKSILPSMNSSGIVSHIPMPGHPVGESLKEETLANIETITQAISEHDVIFLLLDTREARWLPTLIAARFGKIVINAALGFDSYLVMRHGTAQDAASSVPMPTTEYVSGHELGCYFCNDVTAPGNSMKDRTLDQQCTVTRPGVAAIAGALAVEMTVALLQHRLKINAPAAYNLNQSLEQGLNPDAQGILGPIPHSIRGFLWSYQTVVPTCVKFKQCIACSDHVMKQYVEHGTQFLLQVFDDATYLERVTGLTELHLAAEMVDVLELSDNDDDEEMIGAV